MSDVDDDDDDDDNDEDDEDEVEAAHYKSKCEQTLWRASFGEGVEARRDRGFLKKGGGRKEAEQQDDDDGEILFGGGFSTVGMSSLVTFIWMVTVWDLQVRRFSAPATCSYPPRC